MAYAFSQSDRSSSGVSVSPTKGCITARGKLRVRLARQRLPPLRRYCFRGRPVLGQVEPAIARQPGEQHVFKIERRGLAAGAEVVHGRGLQDLLRFVCRRVMVRHKAAAVGGRTRPTVAAFWAYHQGEGDLKFCKVAAFDLAPRLFREVIVPSRLNIFFDFTIPEVRHELFEPLAELREFRREKAPSPRLPVALLCSCSHRSLSVRFRR